MMGYGFFLAFAVKYPRPRMRQIKQFKQCGLLYFILHTFVCMIAWKSGFADRIEKIGIKGRRVIYFICLPDLFGFLRTVIREI